MNNSVAIVGAGLAGRLQALALGRADFQTTLIDRARITGLVGEEIQPTHQDKRTSALTQESVKVLESLGVWSLLAASATPVRRMKIGAGASIEQGWSHCMTLDHSSTDQDQLAWIVDNSSLGSAINQQLAQQVARGTVVLREQTALSDIGFQTSHALLCFDDGTTLRVDVLVGCDGRQSPIRKLCFDDVGLHPDYKSSALVAVLTHSVDHQATASQIFLPNGPVALLPMTPDDMGRPRSSLIWSTATDWAQAVLALPAPERQALLSERLIPITGKVTGIDALESFPLKASLSAEFAKANVALVGDAAHAIHPLAGQGFNLAIGDIACLTQTLQRAQQLGSPIGAALSLEPFAKSRQAAAQRMFALTDGLQRLFKQANALSPTLSKWSFATLEQLPHLKASLIHLALK